MPKSEKKPSCEPSGQDLPQEHPHCQPGAPAQPQVSPAEGEAVIQPGIHRSRQKEKIRRPVPPAAQRTQKIIPKAQRRPQGAGGKKPQGAFSRSDHRSSRSSQPPWGFGSS